MKGGVTAFPLQCAIGADERAVGSDETVPRVRWAGLEASKFTGGVSVGGGENMPGAAGGDHGHALAMGGARGMCAVKGAERDGA